MQKKKNKCSSFAWIKSKLAILQSSGIWEKEEREAISGERKKGKKKRANIATEKDAINKQSCIFFSFLVS